MDMSEVQGEAWKPAAYQKRAVKFLLEHAAAGLLLDPGLRKTSICLAAIKLLRAEGLLERVLVIAPMRVGDSVWNSDDPDSELRKWTDFHGLTSVVLHGNRKDQLLRTKADLYVINPEGLEWLMTGTRFRQLNPDTLIVDESTKFKNTRTVRHKLLAPALNYFRRRWILTGSPSPNGLLDLYGQIKILDLGAALGRFYTHYRSSYFSSGGFGGFTWSLKEGAEEAIYRAIAPLTLRIDLAEAGIDVPKLVDNPIRIQLPASARRVYNEMEEELLAKLDSHVITAANAAVAAGKCAQVANGGIYLDPRRDDDGVQIKESRQWLNLHTAKLDALEDLHEELEHRPLLVAYDYAHDLARLQERFDAPYLGSGVSKADERAIKADWNAGRLPMLLGNPGSVAWGLNLQENCRHVAWHSLTFNFEYYDQFIRRVVRSGNKAKRVMNHLLIAQNTVDEVKLAAMRRKDRTQSALLNALQAYAKRRRRGG